MKLKVKLTFLFLLILLLVILFSALYKTVFVTEGMLIKEKETKEIYIREYRKIADNVTAMYPDLTEIGKYLKQVSEGQDVSIKLYNNDLSTKVLSYNRPHRLQILTYCWIPVEAYDNGIVYFLEVERPLVRLKEIVLSPMLYKMAFPSFAIMGSMFIILTVYFYFDITRPIEILNTRLKNLKMGRSLDSMQYKRNDEIGELYARFNETEERLRQAHMEQINMIAAIAHDLKTPLTTIKGFVELLSIQASLSEEEKQEYYKLILKKTEDITELINEFSAYTRDELELEMANMKSIEVRKLFESIAAEYDVELSGFDYELIWNHSFNSSQFIMSNEHMLRRVFGNLFSNAVRYSERKDLKIYMNGYARGQYVYIQIEDNGVGVPDKDLSSVFHKFFMVDKSRRNKKGGTGLGLASCKSIIQYHDGEIYAFHSNYGGLGIRITLPLAN